MVYQVRTSNMNSVLTSLILILFAFFVFSDALKPAGQHRRSHKKVHKHGGHQKRQQQLYGVSLSSITGFEKPMIPPNIINFDIPINYERPPVNQDLFTLDLPTKLDFLANNQTNPITDLPLNPQ